MVVRFCRRDIALLTLALCLCATGARAQMLQRGIVIDRVECSDDTAQTYALYLPSGYSPERTWSLLLAFHPAARGRLMVEKYQAAAEQYGYIVAASNNSRNGPYAVSMAAAQAMMTDVSRRFSIDPRRVYLAGMSGGARVAMGLALANNNVAGVIASSAGYPDSQPRTSVPFAVFSTAGIEDFNYIEMRLLDRPRTRRAAPGADRACPTARSPSCGRSAVKHRPADVVPQPLVVKHELANRLRELVTLPPALESPCAVALAFRRARTCGLDRIGGRTEFVRGDVRDDPGLAGSVRGMPRCPTQVPGRGHGLAGRRASLGHLDLATHPGASMLDRLTRSWVLRLSRLEQVKDVLRARCRPKREELVIRIGEGPTAADRHEARVSDLREDHGRHSYHPHPPNTFRRPGCG